MSAWLPVPGPRLLAALALLLALSLAATAVPALTLWWQAAAALLAGAALLDAWWLRGGAPFEASRLAKRSVPVGMRTGVTLRIRNVGARPVSARVFDHHPAYCDVSGQPRDVHLGIGEAVQVDYELRPRRRGSADFAGTEVLLAGPLGLWWRRHFLALGGELRVYPNFSQIARFTLLASEQRLARMGVHRRQRRGEGNDFHQLREYRAGDALRQIEWKASARHRRLITREYQDERDQQLVFLLDSGRRMRHEEAQRVHLDEALNAVLLLAYVATRQGDGVGLMAFGGEPRWCAPRTGAGSVRRLLQLTYDLHAGADAADYLLAARNLLAVQPKRALVVLVTNTRHEDQRELGAALALLRRRHLVVLADLREQALDETVHRPVRDLDGALRLHAVNAYLQARRKAHETLAHHGALVLDVTAPQLPAALVNQYLSIKRAGRL